MIEREELTGCSCRFDIKSITVHDADGTMLDTETAPERQDDPGLFFIAQRTTLQEISLTAMPSDPPAMVRACSVDAVCWAAIHDGEERLQRILRPDRHSDDDLYRRDALADRERVHYGAPEPLQTRQYPDDDDGLRRVLCRRPGWFSTRRRSSLRHDSKFPIR
jgi:hypothetical protein